MGLTWRKGTSLYAPLWTGEPIQGKGKEDLGKFRNQPGHLGFSNCAGWMSLGGERDLVNQIFLKNLFQNAPKW